MKAAPKTLVSNIITLLLCITGFILCYNAFYPGFLSSDSMSQYEQSLSGKYNTWHPTIMAYTWHLLNYIHKGPQLMLILQLFFLWTSCFLMAITLKNWVLRIAIVLLFLFAPFIENFAGWVVKDTMMAFSWLLAASIMFYFLISGKKSGVFIAIVTSLLLLYGAWMRYNAIVALPPLCIAWAWMVFRNRKTIVKLFSAALLTIVIFLGQGFFDNVLLKSEKASTEFQIYFHDLAGLFVRYNKNYFPEALYHNPDFDTAYIRIHYNPIDVTVLLWNPDNKQIIRDIDGYNVNDELKKAWLHMLKKEPVLYFKHRLYIYEYFLTLKKKDNLQYHFAWVEPNPYGFKLKDNNSLYTYYAESMIGLDDKIYFQVWFWVLLNVLLFPLAFLLKNKVHRLYYLCIVSAGFLYTLPQFMVANTVRDFRYIYWSCLACILSILTIIASIFLNKKQSGRIHPKAE
jgi:hypothetical protein